jgi:hypothetical protein
MRFVALSLFAGITVTGAIALDAQKSKRSETLVIISGGAMGHLSPCGCTKPMSGGIKRLGTIVRQYKTQGNAIWIDSGRIVEDGSRQSQLKFETYLETLGELKADVFYLSKRDRVLGEDGLVSGRQLGTTKWVGSSNLAPKVEPNLKFGALRVSAIDPNAEILLQENKSISQASKKGITVFPSEGAASVDGRMVSPGSHLRGYVLATFSEGKLRSVRAISLASSISEDKQVEKLYKNYLSRVKSERLVHKMDRFETDEYVGSEKCISCHQKESQIHSKSRHAHAFTTLEKDGHDADPDCISCHVVGVNSVFGFRYGEARLAEVGCESCHGAGGEHIKNPKSVKFLKKAADTCVSCHTSTTSPGFHFLTFWSKIKH